MPSPKLQQIKTLLEVAHNSLTKDDFVKSFQNVVNLVLKVEKSLIDKTDTAWLEMKAEVESLSKRLEMDNETDFSSLKESLIDTVSKALKEQEDGMNFVRDTLRRVKDGKQGQKGDKGDPGQTVAGPAGPPGAPGSPDTPEMVADKLESLEGDARLDKSAIKGIEGIEQDIKRIDTKPAGKGYGTRQDIWHTGDMNTMHTLFVQTATPVKPALHDIWVDIN
jgi:hypothetical protein